MTREPATAPPGRVTLAQAAQMSGYSRKEVHKRVTRGDIPGIQGPDGVWTIAERDVALLKKRKPKNGKRIAVMIRVPRAEYAAWEKAAGDKAVSSWGRKLMNDAAGYKAE